MKSRLMFLAALSALMILATGFGPLVWGAPGGDERDKIPDRYKWNLADIFPTEAAWEAAFEKVGGMIDDVAALKGTLGESAEALLGSLEARDKLSAEFAHVSTGR